MSVFSQKIIMSTPYVFLMNNLYTVTIHCVWSWEIRDFVNFKWLETVSHGSVAVKLNKLTFVSISHDDSKSETGVKYELFRVLKPLFSFIGLQFLYSRNDIYLIWRLVNLYMYLICIYKSVMFLFQLSASELQSSGSRHSSLSGSEGKMSSRQGNIYRISQFLK